jgi:hypothetical protein
MVAKLNGKSYNVEGFEKKAFLPKGATLVPYIFIKSFNEKKTFIDILEFEEAFKINSLEEAIASSFKVYAHNNKAYLCGECTEGLGSKFLVRNIDDSIYFNGLRSYIDYSIEFLTSLSPLPTNGIHRATFNGAGVELDLDKEEFYSFNAAGTFKVDKIFAIKEYLLLKLSL